MILFLKRYVLNIPSFFIFAESLANRLSISKGMAGIVLFFVMAISSLFDLFFCTPKQICHCAKINKPRFRH